ncbi:Fic family protein [bacterium]|nr:Fic family protein [bacterium]
MDKFIPQEFPFDLDLKGNEYIKKLVNAHKAVATLNGVSKIIPNEMILINTLVLRESKESSEIENIITTYDEVYHSLIDETIIANQATKEVQNYQNALLEGYRVIKDDQLFLLKHIIRIQEILEQNSAGIRRQAGTVLKNPQTGEIKHTPPQNYNDILRLLSNLERYINDDSMDDLDPLIKMALIHYQFETIHPFYDGNGRTGRIINTLYLVYKGLLDLPILYLSRYIIKNKTKYYQLFGEIQEKKNWNEWIFYILDGIEETSKESIEMIKSIDFLMKSVGLKIESELPKIYSKDLLEILFYYPYTKIEFLVEKLKITRKTASKYLKEIESIGVLETLKLGKTKFFVNTKLFNILKYG